jgi:hypothetical protein
LTGLRPPRRTLGTRNVRRPYLPQTRRVMQGCGARRRGHQRWLRPWLSAGASRVSALRRDRRTARSGGLTPSCWAAPPTSDARLQGRLRHGRDTWAALLLWTEPSACGGLWAWDAGAHGRALPRFGVDLESAVDRCHAVGETAQTGAPVEVPRRGAPRTPSRPRSRRAAVPRTAPSSRPARGDGPVW